MSIDPASAFDADKRAEAKRCADVHVRTSQPVMVLPAAAATNGTTSAFIMVRNARLMMWLGSGRQARHAATVSSIARHLHTPGAVLVPVDSLARKALVELANRAIRSENASDSDKHAMRYVRVAVSMPIGSRVVTLTEALCRKWYLPAGLDENSLSSWAEAMRLGRSGRDLCALFESCAAGDFVASPGQRAGSEPAIAKQLRQFDDVLLRSLRVHGHASEATAFSASEHAVESLRAMQFLDSAYRHRGVLDGSMWPAEPDRGVLSGTPAWRTHSTPKFRRGDAVWLTPLGDGDAKVARMSLAHMSMGSRGEVLFALVSAAARGGDASVVSAWHTQKQPIAVTTAPHFGAPSAVRWNEWMSAEAPTVEKVRSVPLDVQLAGG